MLTSYRTSENAPSLLIINFDTGVKNKLKVAELHLICNSGDSDNEAIIFFFLYNVYESAKPYQIQPATNVNKVV